MLVRNGDAHLKNFGVLYDDQSRWLAPLFDVVTTTIYPYDRGGVRVTDRTMALRLTSDGERRYPLPAELISFGCEHCGLERPEHRVEALRDAMRVTLTAAKSDERIPRRLLKAVREEWNQAP